MSWFKKLRPSRIRTEGGNKRNVPEGLWTKCTMCTAVLYRPELERNLQVCPKCSHHLQVSARTRLEQFLDPGEQREIAVGLESIDVLRFKDSKRYKDRLSAAQKKTGETDALIAIAGELKGSDIVACAFEFGFMGGSMGSVVGEKFTRAGQESLRKVFTISSTADRSTCFAMALSLASCITGPSAIGSENGTPSSRTSAPAATSACISGTVQDGSGSPAVINGINNLRPAFPAWSKQVSIRELTGSVLPGPQPFPHPCHPAPKG